MRQPIAIQTHYKGERHLLEQQIKDLFHHKRGPGALPAKQLLADEEKEPVQALIVPHATYDLAGPCMSWAYKELAEHKKENPLYIIIGQAQNSTQSGTTTQKFGMPEGEVRVDQDFVRDLVSKGNIAINDEAHNEESVIEIQLPFLQFISGIYRDQVKFAPLLVNAQTNLNALAVDIKETLVEQNKEAVFIFVSNLTSYGREFHYVPFTENIPANIAELDKEVIKALQQFNREEFETIVSQKMIPISGYSALELMFYLIKPESIRLEQNYLSGDINNSYTNTVSYASFIIK